MRHYLFTLISWVCAAALIVFLASSAGAQQETPLDVVSYEFVPSSVAVCDGVDDAMLKVVLASPVAGDGGITVFFNGPSTSGTATIGLGPILGTLTGDPRSEITVPIGLEVKPGYERAYGVYSLASFEYADANGIHRYVPAAPGSTLELKPCDAAISPTATPVPADPTPTPIPAAPTATPAPANPTPTPTPLAAVATSVPASPTPTPAPAQPTATAVPGSHLAYTGSETTSIVFVGLGLVLAGLVFSQFSRNAQSRKEHTG